MSQTAEARLHSMTIEQQLAVDLETRFEAWDWEYEAVRTWALGSRNQVVSLVRVLAEAEEEEDIFIGPI